MTFSYDNLQGAPAKVTWTTFSSSRDNLPASYISQSFELGYLIGSLNHDYCFGGDLCGLMGQVYQGVNNARALCSGEEKSKIISVPYASYYKPELDKHFDIIDVKHNLRDQQICLQEPATHIVALPGGIGTRAEIWNTIEELRCNTRYQNKKLWLINTDNTYKHLLKDFKSMIKEGTARSQDFNNVHIVKDVEELKLRLESPIPLSFNH